MSQSSEPSDPSFIQGCTEQFTNLHNALQGVNLLFSNFAQDKGLANYDKSNPTETALKQIVNGIKDSLSMLDAAVYNLPGGSILGPSAYSVIFLKYKCDVYSVCSCL